MATHARTHARTHTHSRTHTHTHTIPMAIVPHLRAAHKRKQPGPGPCTQPHTNLRGVAGILRDSEAFYSGHALGKDATLAIAHAARA